MGIDDRIALQRQGLDPLNDPAHRGMVDYSTQSPIGARYYDTGVTNTGFTAAVTNTFDFRVAAGTQYDPYNMIDMVNDRVVIQAPGYYDILCEIFVDNMVAAGDFFFAEFVQGIIAPTGLRQMSDFVRAPAAGVPARLVLSAQGIPMTKAIIGNGAYWYVRGTALTNNQNARIVSFSIWMRSAIQPSKF